MNKLDQNQKELAVSVALIIILAPVGIYAQIQVLKLATCSPIMELLLNIKSDNLAGIILGTIITLMEVGVFLLTWKLTSAVFHKVVKPIAKLF